MNKFFNESLHIWRNNLDEMLTWILGQNFRNQFRNSWTNPWTFLCKNSVRNFWGNPWRNSWRNSWRNFRMDSSEILKRIHEGILNSWHILEWIAWKNSWRYPSRNIFKFNIINPSKNSWEDSWRNCWWIPLRSLEFLEEILEEISGGILKGETSVLFYCMSHYLKIHSIVTHSWRNSILQGSLEKFPENIRGGIPDQTLKPLVKQSLKEFPKDYLSERISKEILEDKNRKEFLKVCLEELQVESLLEDTMVHRASVMERALWQLPGYSAWK